MSSSSSPKRLQHEWTWSFKPTIVYKPQSAADWMSDYRTALPKAIATVDEVFTVYQHLPSITRLDPGNIYAVFRDGIEPTWEHPRNCNGYSIVFYPNKLMKAFRMESLYKRSLLMLIGSGYSFSSWLNGCTFERKVAGNKIVFWMSSLDAKPRATVRQILEVLGVDASKTMLTDNAARIDWRSRQFSKYELAIKCLVHRNAGGGEGGNASRDNSNRESGRGKNASGARSSNQRRNSRRRGHDRRGRGSRR